MSRTFTKLLTHVVFATKDREPMIRIEIRSELFAYLGGLTRELKGKAYGINGTNDHVHMLIGCLRTLRRLTPFGLLKLIHPVGCAKSGKEYSLGNSAMRPLASADQMCPPCFDTLQIKKPITNVSRLKMN